MMKWKYGTEGIYGRYYSEDGKWKAYEDIDIKAGKTVFWSLQNLETNEKINIKFKTLKAAKEYAERKK